MLGYLQTQKSELLVKEAEIYKAVYCALCRTIGRDYSIFCRIFLSYDFTFHAILAMALEDGKCAGFHRGRCCCNPLKSCTYCNDSPALHSSAALTVLTAYHKLSDNIADCGAVKSLFYRFIRFFLSRHRKKAMRKYPEFDALLSNMMSKQQAVEAEKDPSIDASCDPTAEMLSGVFSLLGKKESDKRILSEVGYHLGRWIYLADAADDIEKDIKKNNFNCLKPMFSFQGKKKFSDECNALMNMAIAGSYNAFELLNINKFSGILHNLFYYGMPSMQKKILYKEKTEDMNNYEQSV